VTAALLMLAAGLGIGVCFGVALGVKLAGRRITVVEVPAPFVTPSAQLVAALELVAICEARIAVLESVEVAPASRFLALEPLTVPDPIEAHTVQSLMDELQDTRTELAETKELLAVTERRRSQHWRSLKRLRATVKRMVDVAELGYTEALRMRSLSVAKTAQNRAAELSSALSEVEVARMEAMTLEEFNESFEAILGNHGIEVSA